MSAYTSHDNRREEETRGHLHKCTRHATVHRLRAKIVISCTAQLLTKIVDDSLLLVEAERSRVLEYSV
jgi:hypothetical protein